MNVVRWLLAPVWWRFYPLVFVVSYPVFLLIRDFPLWAQGVLAFLLGSALALLQEGLHPRPLPRHARRCDECGYAHKMHADTCERKP